MTTFRAETTGGLDTTHPLASTVAFAILPNEGSGNVLTELLRNDTLDFSTDGLTWNADGSVSASTASDDLNLAWGNTHSIVLKDYVSGLAFSKSFILLADVFIGASSGNPRNTFIALDTTTANKSQAYILADNYSGGLQMAARINFSTPKGTDNDPYTESVGVRTLAVIVWDSVASTFRFIDSAAGYDSTQAETGTETSNDWAGVKIGTGDNLDKLYAAYMLERDGQFTAEEIDSIIADPYQIFRTAEDARNDYGLKLTTGTETLTVSGLVGSWTGTEYNADDTTAAISGTGDYVLTGATVRHLKKVEITDDNGLHYIDCNRTTGNPVDLTGNLTCALVGFPTESGYVYENGEIVGYRFNGVDTDLDFDANAKVAGALSNDCTLTHTFSTTDPAGTVYLLGEASTFRQALVLSSATSLTLYPDGTSGGAVGFYDLPDLKTGAEHKVHLILNHPNITLWLDDVEIETKTSTASVFSSVINDAFHYNSGGYNSGTCYGKTELIDNVDANKSRRYDWTTGDVDTIPELANGQHGTLTVTKTSGWMPISQKQVFTIRANGLGDYSSMSAAVAAQAKNLVEANETQEFLFFNDWPTGLNDNHHFSGYVTGPNNWLMLTVPESERCVGGDITTGFHIKNDVNSNPPIRPVPGCEHIMVTGLGFSAGSGSGFAHNNGGGKDAIVQDCTFNGVGVGSVANGNASYKRNYIIDTGGDGILATQGFCHYLDNIVVRAGNRGLVTYGDTVSANNLIYNSTGVDISNQGGTLFNNVTSDNTGDIPDIDFTGAFVDG